MKSSTNITCRSACLAASIRLFSTGWRTYRGPGGEVACSHIAPIVYTWYRRDFVVPIIHDDARSDLTFSGISVQPHLPLRASQNGPAHLFGAHRDPSREFASAVSVCVPPARREHMPEVPVHRTELPKYLWAVAHEARTLPHRSAVVGFLSQLALVARSARNTLEPENPLNARLRP